MPSCVIIVENLPVPMDRRVWQEANALREAGWQITVICPATKDFPAPEEIIDGIAIYRHPLPLEGRGRLAFLLEYGVALFHELRLLIKIFRRSGFDVIQACNPPDLIFLVALPFTLLGKKFVFDHHDVCPELFGVKFGSKGLMHAAVSLFEHLSFRTADLVVATNETFRQIAITRGGKAPQDVVSVYSVPDSARFFRSKASYPPSSHDKRKIVVGYMGIIGDQDRVDNVISAVRHLITDFNFTNFHCLIVGAGPALESVQSLAAELGLVEHITFTGYLTGDALLNAVSSFDIGVIPDPPDAYNDKISMNKVFEYSAMAIPIVAHRLTETMRLLGDAALFANRPDALGLSEQIFRLCVDDHLRNEMGNLAKARADRDFSWKREGAKYVAAMNQVVGFTAAAGIVAEESR